MADFKIDMRQLKALDKRLTDAGADYKKGRKKLLKKIGVLVLGLARKYCPESPRKADYARMNKSGKTKRKASSITSGQLRDSIRSDVGDDFVSINVPVNSRGGKYAEKMHDERGQSWTRLGVRSKEKGSKVGDEYIYRAASDNNKKINKLINEVVEELVGF